MYLDFNELISKPLKYPVIFLFGDEELLLDEACFKLQSIFEGTKSDSTQINAGQFSLDLFDASSGVALDNILDVCRTYPFLNEKRFVHIKNFDYYFSSSRSKKIDKTNPLVRYLDSTSDFTFLLLSANVDSLNGLAAELTSTKNKAKAEKRIESAKFPFNLLLQKAAWTEFPKLNDRTLPSWIKARLSSDKKKIDEDALELLLSYSNRNLRQLSNEVEKLVLFTSGRNIVNYDDVTAVVGISKEYNVFELQKAVGKRDIEKVTAICKNMLSNDRQEILIITMITRYFLTLFKLLDEIRKTQDKYQLASAIGVNQYFIQEYLDSLRNYREFEIENAFEKLLTADKLLKSSSTDGLYLIQRCLTEIVD